MKRITTEESMKCRYCAKPYKVKFYLTQHEKKCRVNVSEEESSEEESLNEDIEDDLFSDSDQSEVAEEIEVEIAEEENATKKLKKISTELLYTDNKSRMKVLLDQLETWKRQELDLS